MRQVADPEGKRDGAPERSHIHEMGRIAAIYSETCRKHLWEIKRCLFQ
jgi:hypothetical protein